MSYTRDYTDLNRALDDVQPLLNDWTRRLEDGSTPMPSTEHLRYARLVLHEWIANLLQHAGFSDRAPSISIHLSTENRHVYCSVVDNSTGFDLEHHLPAQEDAVESFPERGMGLRIIDACTDTLTYTSIEAGRHRFAFSIPSDHDPWMSMQF